MFVGLLFIFFKSGIGERISNSYCSFLHLRMLSQMNIVYEAPSF